MSDVMPAANETLIIKYDSEESLPVILLGRALTAIGEDFQNFSRQIISKNSDLTEKEIDFLLPTLVINHADEGSLTVWLSLKYAQIKGWTDQASVVIGYAKHLQKIFDYFTGRSKEKPSLMLKDLHNVLPFLLPNVTGAGGPLLIEASNGAETFKLAYGKEALRAADNKIKAEIVAREAISTSNMYSKVLFYWYRATMDPNNRAGDRGIIEEITKKPVRTYIDDSLLKSKMLEGPIADRSYLVTVRVSTKQSIPHLYHILELHEVID